MVNASGFVLAVVALNLIRWRSINMRMSASTSVASQRLHKAVSKNFQRSSEFFVTSAVATGLVRIDQADGCVNVLLCSYQVFLSMFEIGCEGSLLTCHFREAIAHYAVKLLLVLQKAPSQGFGVLEYLGQLRTRSQILVSTTCEDATTEVNIGWFSISQRISDGLHVLCGYKVHVQIVVAQEARVELQNIDVQVVRENIYLHVPHEAFVASGFGIRALAL